MQNLAIMVGVGVLPYAMRYFGYPAVLYYFAATGVLLTVCGAATIGKTEGLSLVEVEREVARNKDYGAVDKNMCKE